MASEIPHITHDTIALLTQMKKKYVQIRLHSLYETCIISYSPLAQIYISYQVLCDIYYTLIIYNDILRYVYGDVKRLIMTHDSHICNI